MSGWKTVESKRNRKVKKARDEDFYSDEEDFGGGFGSASTDYRVTNTAAGRLMSQYHQQKAEAAKGHVPTRVELTSAKAKEAEELEKRRAEKKVSAAEAARQKRREAQEHAKRANDASKWPTVAEQLAVQSEAFMDHFDDVMDEDPIVSKGGIGALLLYAPSIFEKFTYKTRLTPEEARGEVYLTHSVENQAEEHGEALDTFIYYKSLLTKMPEVKSAMSTAASSSSSPQQTSVLDGMLALLSAVWGTKGLKNALVSKDSGRGGTIAIELTFEQLWALGLQNIVPIAEMFVNAAKNESHSPQSVLNFHRIFTIMVNSANASEDKDSGRIAIARATALLLCKGYLSVLFGSAKKANHDDKKGRKGGSNAKKSASSPTSPASDKSSSSDVLSPTADDSADLLDEMASAIRYVALKNLANKAYAAVPFKEACGPVADTIVKKYVAESPLNGPWAILAIELIARQNQTLAKSVVAPLLDALELELATARCESFAPAESSLVVTLSTIFALFASAAAPVLKAHASKAPKAALLFFTVAKVSKLFETTSGLEEAVMSAARKAGADEDSLIKAARNVKVDQLIPTKAKKEDKGGKTQKGGNSKKEQGSAGEEKEKKESGSGGGGLLRVFLSLAVIGAATAFVLNGADIKQFTAFAPSSKANAASK